MRRFSNEIPKSAFRRREGVKKEYGCMRAYAVCALRPRDTFLPLHHTLQALHPSRLIPSSAIDLLHHNLPRAGSHPG